MSAIDLEQQERIRHYINTLNNRERRNYLINERQPRPIDPKMINKNSITYNLLPGVYGKNEEITLNKDGTITIGIYAFYEDVIAFLSFATRGSPDITRHNKSQMRAVVNKADNFATQQKKWYTQEELWYDWIDYY